MSASCRRAAITSLSSTPARSSRRKWQEPCPPRGEIAEMLKNLGKPLDLVLTASLDGLDLDMRGSGALDFSLEQALIAAARDIDLARHLQPRRGPVRTPRARDRRAVAPASRRRPAPSFRPPPPARRLWRVSSSTPWAGRRRPPTCSAASDTFALRLAEKAEVFCADGDAGALAACLRGARETPGLRPVKGERRDLFDRPLLAGELASFDAVIFDPPRAGAEAQARELAKSDVPTLAGCVLQPADVCARRKNPDRRGLCAGAGDAG